MGQYIREALQKSLDMENGPEANEDSFFLDNVVFNGKTPEDLASDHDEFLYGDKK